MNVCAEPVAGVVISSGNVGATSLDSVGRTLASDVVPTTTTPDGVVVVGGGDVAVMGAAVGAGVGAGVGAAVASVGGGTLKYPM